jgi:inhibitor of KinA
MRIEPLGDSALIIRVVEEFHPEKSLDAVLRVAHELERAALPGVIELAPAYATVGVFFDPARTGLEPLGTAIEDALRKMEPARSGAGTGSTVEVPVCYENEFAPDLREVAWHAKLSVEEVVKRHSSATYRVSCVGFTPGFPYLSGLPAELAVPRRDSPRKRIPSGSVGIGGAQTGIYPSISPGGWNIIGRTPLRLFDVQRESPALLHAGDHVRFRRISREEFEQSPT